ncbi:hypothetical protein IAT40_003853 [Kwoniella sp. CBS 6097]
MDDPSIEDLSIPGSTSIPTPTPIPTQAELVRALESIDDSVLAHHHAHAASHIHEHEHEHEIENGDNIHDLVEIGDVHETADEAQIDLTNVGTQDATTQVQRQDNHQVGDKQLMEWSKEELQAEVLRLRSLVQPTLVSSSSTPVSGAASVFPLTASSSAVSSLPVSAPRGSVVDFTDSSIAIDPTLDPSQNLHQVLDPSLSTVIAVTENSKKRGRRKKSDVNTGGNKVGDGIVARPKRINKKPKIAKLGERDEGTGKRLEKERRTELGRVIRTKIRSSIGVSLEAILPHPINELDPITGLATFVPDWSLTLNDETNSQWINNIALEVFEEASAGLHPKIPNHDISTEIIDAATNTAFLNMCKRYANENDPKGVERREKYTKKRRRWARKDLKQKRRFRSSTDSSFADISLPPSALNIDYMSSEYSSSGEEDNDNEGEIGFAAGSDNHSDATTGTGTGQAGLAQSLKEGRNRQWAEMRGKQKEEETSSKIKESIGANANASGKGGWAVGISEKVLEVRTPKWRSETLNEIYRRLDAYANEQADSRATGGSSSSHNAATNIGIANRPTPANYLASLSAANASASANANSLVDGQTAFSAVASTSTTPTPTPKPGHVAPSHRRFVMPPHLMREGKAPRNLGEGWMWASGQVGVWPQLQAGQPSTFTDTLTTSHGDSAVSAGAGAGEDGVEAMVGNGNEIDIDNDDDGGVGIPTVQVGQATGTGAEQEQEQEQEDGDIEWPIAIANDEHSHVPMPTLDGHDQRQEQEQGQKEQEDDAAHAAREREEAHRLGLVSALEGL